MAPSFGELRVESRNCCPSVVQPGRVVLRIEIQHDRVAGVVRQAERRRRVEGDSRNPLNACHRHLPGIRRPARAACRCAPRSARTRSRSAAAPSARRHRAAARTGPERPALRLPAGQELVEHAGEAHALELRVQREHVSRRVQVARALEQMRGDIVLADPAGADQLVERRAASSETAGSGSARRARPADAGCEPRPSEQ